MQKAKPLNNKELAFFCEQMAVIIQAGISTLEAVQIMQEDASDEDATILSEIENDILQTGNLAHAIDKTKVFPDYCIQMINIGETTGNLDTVLKDLGSYYNREHEIATAVENAITYPTAMSLIILTVIFILLAKVMPIFETVFHQLGTDLTGMTKILLLTGIVLEKYAFIFMFMLLIGLCFTLFCLKSEKAKNIRNKFYQTNVFMKDIQYKISACHFAGIMSIVLHSGTSANEGFTMADRVNTDPVFQKKLNMCKAKMQDGSSFGMALKQSGIFSGIYARMITIGYKTGSLEETMANIAAMYEKNITETIDNKIKSIEPVFIILLSAIVGIILLSVMIPLLSIIATL